MSNYRKERGVKKVALRSHILSSIFLSSSLSSETVADVLMFRSLMIANLDKSVEKQVSVDLRFEIENIHLNGPQRLSLSVMIVCLLCSVDKIYFR